MCNQYDSYLKFEAAVAGGIPIIKILNEFLKSNNIKRIYGILNGTSNYILTNMLSTKKNFSEILQKAQKLGYAESDPTFDINGIDAAHKLSILSAIAFDIDANLSDIFVEGISEMELIDLMYAETLGYKIKLLGMSQIKNNNIFNFVYPCLIDFRESIANVDGVYNGIVVESDFCNKSFFQGEGAGSNPTATSVFSDIINISNNHSNKLRNPKEKKKNQDISERFGSYYLRFTT